MGKTLYDETFIKELQEFSRGKNTKQLAEYLEAKTSRKFKDPTIYSFVRKYNLEIKKFDKEYSDEVVEEIRSLAKRFDPQKLREYFNTKYNKNLTEQGFYQFLYRHQIKSVRKGKVVIPPEKASDSKKDYKIWSKEEINFLEEVLEKKRNISLPKIRREMSTKLGVIRSINSIKSFLGRLELTFLNRKNSDLKTDFYHIKKFVEQYGVNYERLKGLLKENDIKIFTRGRFKMIHIDDIEEAEAIVKNYKKTTYSTKKKEGYMSGREFCKKFYMNQETLKKYINNGIIQTSKNTKGYLISSEEIKKYETKIKCLENDYYGYMYIVNSLGLSGNNITSFARTNNIRTEKHGFITYYNKKDVDKLVGRKLEIEKYYVTQHEAAKLLGLPYENFRKAKDKKFGLKTEYFLGKGYIRLESIKALLVSIHLS